MTGRTWTPLDEIARVAITQVDGSTSEFDLADFVTDTRGEPLWLVRIVDDLEVILPWSSIATLTVLERHPPKPPYVPVRPPDPFVSERSTGWFARRRQRRDA